MNNNPTLDQFPIRELVRRTGVNASTLRAWENRHGLIDPARTPSGHRLYGEKDVQRVRRLQELLVQGLSLREVVAVLTSGDPSRLANPLESPGIPASEPVLTAWQGYLQETLRALEDFSSERLDNLYNEACAIYPIDLLTENLLIPVLQHLGDRWESRPSGIAEEHFFSAWLRNKLGARLHHSAGQARGKPLLLACLPHEHHEIGLLLFALSAAHRGFRVVYLGSNLPISQLEHVVARAHTSGIVLAGRDAEEPSGVLRDIAHLLAATRLPVFVGSHFSVQTREALIDLGAIPLGSHISHGLNLIEQRLARPRSRKLPAQAGNSV